MRCRAAVHWPDARTVMGRVRGKVWQARPLALGVSVHVRFPTVLCLNYFSLLNPVLSLYRKNPRLSLFIPKTVIKMEFRYVIVLVRNGSSWNTVVEYYYWLSWLHVWKLLNQGRAGELWSIISKETVIRWWERVSCLELLLKSYWTPSPDNNALHIILPSCFRFHYPKDPQLRHSIRKPVIKMELR